MSGWICAKGGTGSVPRVADVCTASTPGAASASLVSIATMRACAKGLRTKIACAVPSMRRSST